MTKPLCSPYSIKETVNKCPNIRWCSKSMKSGPRLNWHFKSSSRYSGLSHGLPRSSCCELGLFISSPMSLSRQLPRSSCRWLLVEVLLFLAKNQDQRDHANMTETCHLCTSVAGIQTQKIWQNKNPFQLIFLTWSQKNCITCKKKFNKGGNAPRKGTTIHSMGIFMTSEKVGEKNTFTITWTWLVSKVAIQHSILEI